MTDLVMGANAPLGATRVTVTVAWKDRDPAAEELDVSMFLLTDAKKVRGDNDMIFYGQRTEPGGAVRLRDLAIADGDGRATVFALDLDKVPDGITTLAVVGTTGAHAGARRVSDLDRLSVRAEPDGADPVSFEVDTGTASEAALILGEIYLRNGAWKFRAVGQGFNGGLAPLARNFGVAIDDEPAPAPTPAPTPAPSPAPAPAASPTVNLSKVTLTKERPSVDLSKKPQGFGQIEINLNWNPGQSSGFFGLGGGKNIDLDLGCLFETADGRAGAVQALGNVFGAYDQPPYIQLAGDDRSGSSADGEWMRINGAHWNQLRRVLIFAFIYEGVPNWAQADALVTLYMPDDAPIEVRLDESAPMGMCAIAEVQNMDGGIRMTRHVRYFRDHEVMSNEFRYPLRWKAGRK